MRYFHPKKICRYICVKYNALIDCFNICNLKIQAKYYGISLILSGDVKLKGCHISAKRKAVLGNKISLKDCDLLYTNFNFYDQNNSVCMNGERIIGSKESPTILWMGTNTLVTINEGTLFSLGIDICTTDFHSVYDAGGNRINSDKSITIGKNCWIGRKTYIGKGCSLPNGTIVGAYSIVTKSFDEANTIIAGNPASIKKRNIYWKA